ncbi:MAG: glycosyltransferase [Deltaproteobacteria bacterium]|nr:glycosyltransferase [Deltaproteobacteria bacterium]
MPLVVAHVLSSFGMGGQERVALDLAVGQKQAGLRVIAVSLAPRPDGPLAGDFAAAGVPTRTVAKRQGFDMTLPFRLAWHLRKERVGLVHTHNPQPLIYGAPAARLAGAAVVHTKHGANPSGQRRMVLRRVAATMVDAYVAVSELTAEVARKGREVDVARLHVIPNGIDLSRFGPDAAARRAVREELGIPEGAWIVGTVGRLSPEKNQALLLKAAAPVLGDGFRVVVVGSGAEENALRALGASFPRGELIHFTGARRDVPRLLAAFDVFALTSRTEGLPLVIPEAMASGIPVVATAVGGIPNVVDEGVTGFLVPSGDEDALRRRLVELAGDAALAQGIGGEARRVALERYSAERMVREYLGLYERVRKV